MNYLAQLLAARYRQCMIDPRARFSVTMLPVTRDDGDGGEGGAGGDTGGGSGPRTLTQDEVNAIIAKEKRKFEAKVSEVQNELKKFREGGLSADERKELEDKLEKARRAHMSVEEKAKEDLRAEQKKAREELDSAKKAADSWKNLYTTTKVKNDLISAASSPDVKAHNPELLVNILQNKTTLDEVLDADGRPTGNFVTKVTFEATSEDGKAVVLSLTPQEAVKRMKDDTAKFGSLFASTQKGGFNAGEHGRGKAGIDLSSQEAYIEARKAGKLKSIGA